MDYQQKLILIDKVLVDLESGKSEEHIKTELTNQAIPKIQITGIISAALKDLDTKIGPSLLKHIDDQGIDYNQSGFNSLHPNVFQQLANPHLATLKRNEKYVINKLIQEGKKIEDLSSTFTPRFLTEGEVTYYVKDLKEGKKLFQKSNIIWPTLVSRIRDYRLGGISFFCNFKNLVRPSFDWSRSYRFSHSCRISRLTYITFVKRILSVVWSTSFENQKHYIERNTSDIFQFNG